MVAVVHGCMGAWLFGCINVLVAVVAVVAWVNEFTCCSGVMQFPSLMLDW